MIFSEPVNIFLNAMQTRARAQAQATLVSANGNLSHGCCSACSSPQPIFFLCLTLLMTLSATAMLTAAIMTDHWENVTWNTEALSGIINDSIHSIEWVLNAKVGILHKKQYKAKAGPIFLVPMHGGIWTLCIDLSTAEMLSLKRNNKFPMGIVPCVSYLAGPSDNIRKDENRNSWQISESHIQTSLQPHLRMQNLSISCSLVCLIILGSAALVGAFGICQRQMSAVLVTGIMYLLAALFALFTLTIIHYKRQHGRPVLDNIFRNGTVDGLVAIRGESLKDAQSLLATRIITTSWSLDLGWGGVILCSSTSAFWLLLSKVLRYNPISAFAI